MAAGDGGGGGARELTRTARGQDWEPYWPAALTIALTMAFYLTLPGKMTLGPTWIVPALEIGLVLTLLMGHPHRHATEPGWVRPAALAVNALLTFANAGVLANLVRLLLDPDMAARAASGRGLLVSAVTVWLTNAAAFGLWFWECDGGGPAARDRGGYRPVDFLFPQSTSPEVAPPRWSPSFVDYLYVSFTNQTAFSPTDTMPLTVRAKLLMLVQALASLLTVALVAARAVNILG